LKTFRGRMTTGMCRDLPEYRPPRQPRRRT